MNENEKSSKVTSYSEKSSKVTSYRYCLRCGRKLKKPENIERGMGKICWEKSQTEQSRRLF